MVEFIYPGSGQRSNQTLPSGIALRNNYGSCPTVSSAFVSAFYGTKFFPTNFSIMNFNLIGSSLMATACGSLLTFTGGYTTPFVVLLVLALAALVLNLQLKKP